LVSGLLVAAVLADDDIGTIEQVANAGDVTASVLPADHHGVRHMIAGAAIALHANVYTAAAGKVSSTAASTSYLRGIALEAASGDGSVIRVLTKHRSVAQT
jgi:hypothetical protein